MEYIKTKKIINLIISLGDIGGGERIPSRLTPVSPKGPSITSRIFPSQKIDLHHFFTVG
jgi:Flp pilus assembly CpaF family ATPase